MSGAVNQNNLGAKVVSRLINWQQMAMQAWGSEYNAPDHGVYEFSNGKKYDSTDMSQGGVYQPQFGINRLMLEDSSYPDMPSNSRVLQDSGYQIVLE